MSFIKALFNSREQETDVNQTKIHSLFEVHQEQSEKLHAEWNRSKKPANFWKCKENQMIYEKRVSTPNYYTMGYDVDSGERIKANCVESALYIAKKRAGKL